MIKCLSGLPGNGKSYLMTKEIWYALSEGRRVFTNFPHRYCYILKYEDMIDTGFPDGSILFIDEANGWFRNRDWSKFPKEVFQLFMHHRHFHMDMVIVAQSPETLDVQIRDIIQEFVYCRCKGFKWYDRKGYAYKHAVMFNFESYDSLINYIKGSEKGLIRKYWEFKKKWVFREFDSYYKFMEKERKKREFKRWEVEMGIELSGIMVKKYKNLRHYIAMNLYVFIDNFGCFKRKLKEKKFIRVVKKNIKRIHKGDKKI